MRVSKQELKNYVVNSIAHNEFNPNELLRLINHLPDQPTLNENQQILLEGLKNIFTEHNDNWWSVLDTIDSLTYKISKGEIKEADELSTGEEAQVLQEFSQWVLEQEEE